jgi:3-phenylpropionate/trans-cinnamate dioxygenase ferredoxin reductase subunit
MSEREAPVVIIGAGHAGGTAAAALRQLGWTGGVTLIGAEPALPYQRPPLSKAWLKGEANAETLYLKPASFYPASNIDVRLGTRALHFDRTVRIVSLSTGEMLSYHKLILATGSRLNKLRVPGTELAPVLELRTMADAEALKAVIAPGRRIAIVGGGYIGLEVAASATALGAKVTVIEREGRLLPRVASEPISVLFTRMHQGMGVDIRLGAAVTAIEGSNGRVTQLRLGNGELVPCDVVVVGIGAAGEDGLARQAGLSCDNGIVVDAAARSSDPNVYAIGDCTRRPLPLYGHSARLESVPNALEQARQAASDICGKPAPAPEVPWFWSDQYDLKLQIAGFPVDVARQVVRWQQGTSRFAVFHLDAESRVQAVEAVNAAGEYMAGRQMIARRTRVDPARLADLSVPIKELLG